MSHKPFSRACMCESPPACSTMELESHRFGFAFGESWLGRDTAPGLKGIFCGRLGCLPEPHPPLIISGGIRLGRAGHSCYRLTDKGLKAWHLLPPHPQTFGYREGQEMVKSAMRSSSTFDNWFNQLKRHELLIPVDDKYQKVPGHFTPIDFQGVR